jgi:hypothetical protein
MLLICILCFVGTSSSAPCDSRYDMLQAGGSLRSHTGACIVVAGPSASAIAPISIVHSPLVRRHTSAGAGSSTEHAGTVQEGPSYENTSLNSGNLCLYIIGN